MQHDFLKQIPRMGEIILPTNFIDWSTEQLNMPSNFFSKNHGNSAGQRKWPPPLLVDEPQYVIIRNDEAKRRHLGIIFTLNCVFFAQFLHFLPHIFHFLTKSNGPFDSSLYILEINVL